MCNEKQFDEKILWDFVDGSLSLQEEKEILEACEKFKSINNKLEMIKSDNEKIKSAVVEAIEVSPQMTSKIMMAIYESEELELVDNNVGLFSIFIFLILFSCLVVCVFFCIKNIENTLMTLSGDFVVYSIPIVMFIISIFLSSYIRFSVLKRNY